MVIPTQAPPQGLFYCAACFSEAEQHALLRQVQALPFTHDVMHGKPMLRSGTCFGYTYVAVGRRLYPAPPLPEFLLPVVERALLQCPARTQVDMCLVQRYPRDAGIGWHKDASVFGDVILGVSLGAEGRLQFRPAGATQVSYELLLAPGSLYVMQGTARWDWQHRVPPVKAERYSLTFRQVNAPSSGVSR